MSTPRNSTSVDFWLYWTGQTVSNMGRAFSAFAFPLLIFKLHGGSTGLALMMVALFTPNLLFGLFIGAWCDRVDRRTLMIATDVARFAVLAVVGGVGLAGGLAIWMLFVAGFVTSTLDLAFESAEFAVVPALVTDPDEYVKANSRVQVGVQLGALAGPILAGALVLVTPVSTTLLFDAGTYVVSAVTLVLVSRKFNASSSSGGEPTKPTSTIVQDALEGLRYVLRNPTLRDISVIAALSQLFSASAAAQLVLFASDRLHTTSFQLGLLFAADGVALLLLSVVTPAVSRWLGPGRSMLVSIGLRGALLAALAINPWYWLALPLWGFAAAMEVFFSINSFSLRQAIVPDNMLSRVSSVARLLAWSAIPVSVLIGGWVLTKAGVETVYLAMGVLTLLIPIAFTVLGGRIRTETAPPVKATVDAAA